LRRPLTSDALVQASFDELEHILRWVARREGGAGKVKTVLIGGWAVYAYNPYWGSYDIDLVTSSRTRHSMQDFLRRDRGFKKRSDDQVEFTGVHKLVQGAGDILIDFATFETRYPFQGLEDSFDFGCLRDSNVVIELGGLRVPIPDRSTLLLMKLKAARDRQYRLDIRKSARPAWDLAKVIKDRADVLAIIDPEKGGTDLDLARLGKGLERYPMLVETLELCGREPRGIERYGTSAGIARAIVDRTLELTVNL